MCQAECHMSPPGYVPLCVTLLVDCCLPLMLDAARLELKRLG